MTTILTSVQNPKIQRVRRLTAQKKARGAVMEKEEIKAIANLSMDKNFLIISTA